MKRLYTVINLILCLNLIFGPLFPVLTYAQDAAYCTYNEATQNCANGGTRACNGTNEGNGCHYNPDVDPACKESCNCTFNEDPQNCPNGGTRTCQGSDEGEGCHYNEAIDPACQETCTPATPTYPDDSNGASYEYFPQQQDQYIDQLNSYIQPAQTQPADIPQEQRPINQHWTWHMY